MKPLVSILIPSHNAELWVAAAVRSALGQTWPEKEVIVIDDGSTDASPRILERFRDAGVDLTCRSNRGGNATRNELLARARGEWVQFLDADDFLLPEKLADQMAALAARPEADVLFGPVVVEEHRDGKVTRRPSRFQATPGADPWALHLGWNLTQTGGALFRRERLQRVGGWNESQACCQDNELFFRLLQDGATFVPTTPAGAVYRRFVGTSVSTRDGQAVRREILRLIDAGEDWLRSRDGWNTARQRAANGNRFALARQLWPCDPAGAEAVMARVRSSETGFFPAPGPHAPALYRACYRLFGFAGAERISSWRRRRKGAAA